MEQRPWFNKEKISENELKKIEDIISKDVHLPEKGLETDIFLFKQEKNKLELKRDAAKEKLREIINKSYTGNFLKKENDIAKQERVIEQLEKKITALEKNIESFEKQVVPYEDRGNSYRN